MPVETNFGDALHYMHYTGVPTRHAPCARMRPAQPTWPQWQWSSTPWWRHQMETFSALLAICVGNSPVTGEFRAQRPVTQSFDVFFDLRLNKRLSKQSWGWWLETQSRPLWRHCNDQAETHTPKRKCNFDEILVTGCSRSCQNFGCS